MSVAFVQRGRPPPNAAQIQKVSIIHLCVCRLFNYNADSYKN